MLQHPEIKQQRFHLLNKKIMKSKYTILIILMLSVLYSCTDDTIPSAAKNEGSPVMLNLNLAYPESKSLDIETRASLSTSVYDFYKFS